MINSFLGYDFAFARNGYRYHTKYDGFDNIPLGSYQHVGDNILALIKNLGHAPEITNSSEKSQEKIVYYDFLGLFMINYTVTSAFFLNISLAVLSVAVAIKAFCDLGLGT